MDHCRDKIDTCDLNADAEQLKRKLQVFSMVKYIILEFLFSIHLSYSAVFVLVLLHLLIYTLSF